MHLFVFLLLGIASCDPTPPLLQTITAPPGARYFGSCLASGGPYSYHLASCAGNAFGNGGVAYMYEWVSTSVVGPNTALLLSPSVASGNARVSMNGEMILLGDSIAVYNGDTQSWYPTGKVDNKWTWTSSLKFALGSNAAFIFGDNVMNYYTEVNNKWTSVTNYPTSYPNHLFISDGPGAEGKLLFIVYSTSISIYNISGVGQPGYYPSKTPDKVIQAPTNYTFTYSGNGGTINWSTNLRFVVTLQRQVNNTYVGGLAFFTCPPKQGAAGCYQVFVMDTPKASYAIKYRMSNIGGYDRIAVAQDKSVNIYRWKEDRSVYLEYTLKSPYPPSGAVSFYGNTLDWLGEVLVVSDSACGSGEVYFYGLTTQ